MMKLNSRGILGLALAMLNNVSPIMRDTLVPKRSRGHGKGRNSAISQRELKWAFPSIPSEARHWHNPKDPVQADRIAAAEAKRTRKAEKLARDMNHSTVWNATLRADWNEVPPYGTNFIWNRLNPFFVNREPGLPLSHMVGVTL